MRLDYGQVAYEAYSHHAGGVSITGAALPEWREVKPHIQRNWVNTAQSLINRFVDDSDGDIPESAKGVSTTE